MRYLASQPLAATNCCPCAATVPRAGPHARLADGGRPHMWTVPSAAPLNSDRLKVLLCRAVMRALWAFQMALGTMLPGVAVLLAAVAAHGERQAAFVER